MSHVHHLLASLQLDAVTQARASGNYALIPQEGENPNWRIGGQVQFLFCQLFITYSAIQPFALFTLSLFSYFALEPVVGGTGSRSLQGRLLVN